ncbi:MAG TPA: deoxynucleoside kinase [Saprospiraceae bacterium]|nr:deoxynucleoside kinase [Saprospiraceae bacterium]
MKTQSRYKYVCIEGNIGAGKTTLCQLLSSELNCNLILEEFADNPFLEYFYKDPARYSLTVELFFLTERQKQLQSQLLQNNLFTDFHLADYSLIKSLLFAKTNLQEEEFKLFHKIYQQLAVSIPRPELIIYLHRPLNKILEQIQKRGREYELEIHAEYLDSIQSMYFEFFKTQTLIPVLIVDAENMDFLNNKRHYEEIKHLFKQEYQPGIHHIRILF